LNEEEEGEYIIDLYGVKLIIN